MSNSLPTINLKNDLSVDKKLEKIWSDYNSNSDQEQLSGLFQKDVLKNVVTYLSLNPSLQPKDRANAQKGNYPAVPYNLIDWNRPNAEYKFFQKFYDLGKEINPWTILDLLYIRESNQDELKKKFSSNSISDHNKTFVVSQMKLTFSILKELNPKVVVVTNALTVLLIKIFSQELQLKHEVPIGSNGNIYRINGIPFITNESKFLGSRIHSLNIPRRESLIKEIKRVLETTQS